MNKSAHKPHEKPVHEPAKKAPEAEKPALPSINDALEQFIASVEQAVANSSYSESIRLKIDELRQKMKS